MILVTFLLVIATGFLAFFTYKIVKENKTLRKENERQFRISKSPIFDISIDSKLNISDKGIKDGEKLYCWEIPLKIKNIGYGPAFNIYPHVRQGTLEYKFNGISSNIIELGFTLGVGTETTLNFEKSDIIGKQLENLLQIEINCDNIFGNKIIHEFKA
ncbi:MAG TPA: hypothetical protein VF369_02580, partial [candidate division Zixibacteria bacterium]